MNTPKSKTSGLEHELVALRHENKKLKDFLRSFVADAEAMRCPTPDCDLTRDGGKDYQEHWFGYFDASYTDEHDYTEAIQWPCLGILIEQGKELIK